MRSRLHGPFQSFLRVIFSTLCFIVVGIAQLASLPLAQAATPPEPLVAIHVSERTQALETMPASPPTPIGPDFTGFEWWYATWRYFVAYESLKEALRSDGTPFVEVSDNDIETGMLRWPDGSPRYPIVISLAAEAVHDNAIAPLRDYVDAGGFLFVGSSSFTRNPNGTTRGNFALSAEMGLGMVTASVDNWYKNTVFSKVVDHRLVSHIPSGTIAWRSPLFAEEMTYGVWPDYGFMTGSIHGRLPPPVPQSL